MQETWMEIVENFISRGAPGDQGALAAMLRQLQAFWGGSLPADQMAALAAKLGLKESFLLAVIRRIPSLRVGRCHVLEICAGPNCGKHRALAEEAERLCKACGVALKFGPCMRMCGKGPNIKYDGKVYNGADAALLGKLLKEKEAK